MLARLWWKEWRIFGPAELVMLAGAAGVQWFYVASNGTSVMDGSATPIALTWAVLYAYAAGAAAFAGERESKTLGFLDALPVSRATLWVGKASFSLASALGLGLALLLLAALGTEHRNVQKYDVAMISGQFAVWLFEGLAWGLFWSSLLGNPLAAGALAVATAGSVQFLANLAVGPAVSEDRRLDQVRLLAAGLALLASALAITSKWSPIRLPAFRRAERAGGLVVISRGSLARSLVWQGLREGWTTLALAALLLFLGPILAILEGGKLEFPMTIALASIACVLAGVGVFGLENVSGTRRFLQHHGVSPGSAWGWKMYVWLGPMTLMILILGSFLAGDLSRNSAWTERDRAAFCLVTSLFDGFGVGVLCGMAGRRRITAGLVGVIALIALAPVQVAVVMMEMAPAWTLGISPVLLLAASRVWAGDWLADRGGYRPYARLALLVGVPLMAEAGGYVAYRAWSIPDVGPIVEAPAPAKVPAAEDAAEQYRKAASLIWSGGTIAPEPDAAGVIQIIQDGWDPKLAAVDDWLERHQPALEAARKAAAMPRITVPMPDPSDPTSAKEVVPEEDPLIGQPRRLARLLAVEARRRQAEGDLPGAWDDILTQLRMARHLAEARPMIISAFQASTIHHQAVGLAIDWAGDPKQTPAAIRRALDDLRALPPMPGLARTLARESAAIDRLLGLSAGDLSDALFGRDDKGTTSPWTRLGFSLFAAPPWERARARRACRQILLDQLRFAAQEPWERDPNWVYDPNAPGAAFRGTPLARMVLPATEAAVRPLDREVENRRALELVLALRTWQFAHGGQYPDNLEALVPSVLDRLPLDPYSGRGFGYVRSLGQPVNRPIRGDIHRPGETPPATRPGQPLLYSVGPDRKDDHAARSYLIGGGRASYPPGTGDLIVPLP